VPFRIENVQPNDDLYYYISPLHWLDALTPPIEEHISRLVLALEPIAPRKPAHSAAAPTRDSTRGDAHEVDQKISRTSSGPELPVAAQATIGNDPSVGTGFRATNGSSRDAVDTIDGSVEQRRHSASVEGASHQGEGTISQPAADYREILDYFDSKIGRGLALAALACAGAASVREFVAPIRYGFGDFIANFGPSQALVTVLRIAASFVFLCLVLIAVPRTRHVVHAALVVGALWALVGIAESVAVQELLHLNSSGLHAGAIYHDATNAANDKLVLGAIQVVEFNYSEFALLRFLTGFLAATILPATMRRFAFRIPTIGAAFLVTLLCSMFVSGAVATSKDVPIESVFGDLGFQSAGAVVQAGILGIAMFWLVNRQLRKSGAEIRRGVLRRQKPIREINRRKSGPPRVSEDDASRN
jgi:hypothetical protein